MRPCPKPLIRIVIDDEDGDLPSINISPQLDDGQEDYEEYEEERDHEEDHGYDDENNGHFGESLSSSVDSFIQHLDSLHPFRFCFFCLPVYRSSCCLLCSDT